MNWPRIAVDAGLLIIAFIAPWWLSFIIALALSFFFDRYVELIVLGLVLDWQYNTPVPWFGGFQYALSVIAIVSFLLISYLKTFIRFN